MGNINSNLSQYPSNADYTTTQSLADYALGVGAEISGQPYAVYRVSSSSNGNYIQPANLIYSNYPIYRDNFKAGIANGLETDKAFASLWYGVFADMSPMLVGDIFLQTDPVYGAGSTLVGFPTAQFDAIALAAHAPGKTSIGARLDRLVHIYRPNALPNGNYWTTTKDNAQPLTCSLGAWSLAANGTFPNSIPAGFLPEKRDRGALYSGLGDVPGKTRARIYLPPLNGFLLQEDDTIVEIVLNSSDVPTEGARYRVINPYFQNSGVVGFQLICEREVSTSAGMSG